MSTHYSWMEPLTTAFVSHYAFKGLCSVDRHVEPLHPIVVNSDAQSSLTSSVRPVSAHTVLEGFLPKESFGPRGPYYVHEALPSEVASKRYVWLSESDHSFHVFL
ncbi:hypothetical protein A0H81_05019 [Grifola frondosa]|uniref:Uncharacterized protein n=1 Tax=Grifola frondosa TaxID=5627 RepID=A0A1C7MFM1_GRIFR|nr:hypothetical protein A0H81_05019 [Grifola frondosa]